jgi:hypothetical protein
VSFHRPRAGDVKHHLGQDRGVHPSIRVIRVVRHGEDFLYKPIKGTPSARQAVRPWPSVDAGTREHRGSCASWREDSASSRGGSAGTAPTPGRAASRALTGGNPPGAAPPPGSAGPHSQAVPAATQPRCTAARENRPGRRPRARSTGCRAKGHMNRAGTPRIVRDGPSSVKGTRRSFLTAEQKGSPGPTLERRSLCRPSGPDGAGQAGGQARQARGEPPHVDPISIRRTGAETFRALQEKSPPPVLSSPYLHV